MKPVRHQVRARCPVHHAFAVFTERIDAWWPASHRRWPESRLELDTAPGGRLVERTADGGERVLGVITAWSPPDALDLAWYLGANPETATTVRITFRPDGDATLVQVVHAPGPRPLPDWDQKVQIFARAWPEVLAAFLPASESP